HPKVDGLEVEQIACVVGLNREADACCAHSSAPCPAAWERTVIAARDTGGHNHPIAAIERTARIASQGPTAQGARRKNQDRSSSHRNTSTVQMPPFAGHRDTPTETEGQPLSQDPIATFLDRGPTHAARPVPLTDH